jgi:2-dehydro-3-deoxygluconokinase
MALKIKSKQDVRWDMIALGEIMLRFDPGDQRIWTTRKFDVYEGGGEYNVARGLKRCFGLDTAVVTAFADNPIGKLLQDLLYQGGVDQSMVRWVPYDGVGRTVRNGLNFTERGFGVRAALGASDRGHTAISQMKAGDVDWDHVFGKQGARWFHTGGIFCALSESTIEVALEAVQAARKHGTIVSYDLNYRESLWASIGGKKRAQEVNRRIAPFIDVALGNEEDFSAALGYAVPGVDESLAKLNVEGFESMIKNVVKDFPFQVVATTLRQAKTATINDWGAICYYEGKFYQAQRRDDLEIYDRVGGGDSFAAGLIYGFLTDKGPQWAVECGAAHGALAMTTPGDTTTATLKEVLQVMKGGGARIAR